jgi:hypothetical protein
MVIEQAMGVQAGRGDAVERELAAFVEQATGLTIPDQDINAGHFDTIRQIESYLSGRTGA